MRARPRSQSPTGRTTVLDRLIAGELAVEAHREIDASNDRRYGEARGRAEGVDGDRVDVGHGRLL